MQQELDVNGISRCPVSFKKGGANTPQ